MRFSLNKFWAKADFLRKLAFLLLQLAIVEFRRFYAAVFLIADQPYFLGTASLGSFGADMKKAAYFRELL